MNEELDFDGTLWRLREIKAMREIVKGKQTRLEIQPEEMDEQYGSSSTSSWEKEWKVKGT